MNVEIVALGDRNKIKFTTDIFSICNAYCVKVHRIAPKTTAKNAYIMQSIFNSGLFHRANMAPIAIRVIKTPNCPLHGCNFEKIPKHNVINIPQFLTTVTVEIFPDVIAKFVSPISAPVNIPIGAIYIRKILLDGTIITKVSESS